ncbi:MAG: hypothetical protein M1826_003929 [Phylliscum demangeonii]|nr:MAG: hypothetical protein M1826_003929 [Phylliscum demangeonii]
MQTVLNLSPLVRRNVSPAATDLVRCLLNRVPDLRPTQEECFAHAWFDDGTQTDLDPNVDGLRVGNNVAAHAIKAAEVEVEAGV